MAIDIESLLAPISAEAPCGEEARYDPEYVEMERLAQGTEERQVGNAIVAAEEPDWREVRNQTLAVLGKCKDLWAIVHLAWALTRTEGIAGLRDALRLLAGVLEQYWGEVHPQLDPDDSYDPMERLNVLRAFAPPLEKQAAPRMFELLLTTPLCVSPIFHRSYTLRDVRIAKGELEAVAVEDGPPAPDETELVAAFCGEKLEADKAAEVQEQAKATAAAAAEATEAVAQMDQLLSGYVGAGESPDLAAFQGMLQEVHDRVNEYLARGGVAGVEAGEGVEAAPGEPGAAAPGQAISGDIRSPEDVIRVLDKICDYYRQAEPSSPVPLLIRRARNLVRKSFVEIIQDLNPDSLPQIEMISGPLSQPEQP